ncbi:hypothetical protein QBC32DRAFT_7739 [Pseudoneurospora amorphoporcata]|uniref:Uncharacterized protein n=1 Tax=Pseudoneurospora amorphoporcata TaxID=241081 RepID=A0AAN6NS29_9PEZI|nr:hypothetical protein QBC32DRAFT_7739 [Pseudoneurospora amorphoporcata]
MGISTRLISLYATYSVWSFVAEAFAPYYRLPGFFTHMPFHVLSQSTLFHLVGPPLNGHLERHCIRFSRLSSLWRLQSCRSGILCSTLISNPSPFAHHSGLSGTMRVGWLAKRIHLADEYETTSQPVWRCHKT